jgi:hypothetical protein
MRPDIKNLLSEYAAENGENSDEFFSDAMELIRAEAIERNIQFDGYFRSKWEVEAENVMTFDSEYFEDPYKRNLYVYLSALVNQDIYEMLEYIWPFVNDEDLDENIIHREIYFLKELGVQF